MAATTTTPNETVGTARAATTAGPNEAVGTTDLEPEAPARKAPKAPTKYVVQRRGTLDPRGWADVAEVMLPARSHRKSAVLAALAKADVAPEPGQVFRVLDEESAEERQIVAKPPPPPEQQFDVT